MCSFKVFVFFALASMLVLSHFATAIPSLPSEVDLDETPEEIVDDQRPPESLANSLDEMPVEVSKANPFVTEELGKCAKLNEYCEDGQKCCRHLRCWAYYRILVQSVTAPETNRILFPIIFYIFYFYASKYKILDTYNVSSH
nr:PREDICTED: uncharacterized protein LOC109030186 isoform X3 [Bemisia tabaci]